MVSILVEIFAPANLASKLSGVNFNAFIGLFLLVYIVCPKLGIPPEKKGWQGDIYSSLYLHFVTEK